ncbi:helix-turn-helix domain-containing protein [Marinimicrobium sp. C6131]|uniref:helix-turn-helix domain-containing protein n=1 Tax=Marinimicrobium sp. C6131 TaxID=3022676 RepID=UPI00223E7DB9|nr:helix-turn-helix transcriptional regulator [Marinimicrobium sp. C6131]UZJ46176.1 helix-turn-helix domain-containing protein [Marinimicrobium sp. C6131]
MGLKERINEIEREEGLTREELARKMGTNYTRLRNLGGGQTKFRIDDLEVLAKIFPEYVLDIQWEGDSGVRTNKSQDKNWWQMMSMEVVVKGILVGAVEMHEKINFPHGLEVLFCYQFLNGTSLV